MKTSKLKYLNDQSNQKGHGQFEQYNRCEFCNVPIFRNPYNDERSSGVFKGKGKMLCNKCAATLAKMPTEQALQALNNAAEIYSKE